MNGKGWNIVLATFFLFCLPYLLFFQIPDALHTQQREDGEHLEKANIHDFQIFAVWLLDS